MDREITGYIVTLVGAGVDAQNAFNETSRRALIWTARSRTDPFLARANLDDGPCHGCNAPFSVEGSAMKVVLHRSHKKIRNGERERPILTYVLDDPFIHPARDSVGGM
jgi:hypothetical protein